MCFKLIHTSSKVHKIGQYKKKGNNWKVKQQTAYRIPHHHNQTRRLTGFEITSIQIHIFTSVSNLILFYCNNHRIESWRLEWHEAEIFPLKSAWHRRGLRRGYAWTSSLSFIGLNYFIFYFLLYKYHVTPTHRITPTATEWHTKTWIPELQKQVVI